MGKATLGAAMRPQLRFEVGVIDVQVPACCCFPRFRQARRLSSHRCIEVSCAKSPVMLCDERRLVSLDVLLPADAGQLKQSFHPSVFAWFKLVSSLLQQNNRLAEHHSSECRFEMRRCRRPSEFDDISTLVNKLRHKLRTSFKRMSFRDAQMPTPI